MTRPLKIVTIALWIVTVLAMLGVISTSLFAHWRGGDNSSLAAITLPVPPPQTLPVLFACPTFSLTDQDAQPITDHSLLGHVWIADLIFTRCPGPCPMMTAQMTQLQKAIPDPRVQFLSFSVDPKNDTPNVLKQYAAAYKADESRWRFLTGQESAIFDVAAGFKLAAKPADGDQPIFHSQKFLLLDANGKVRGVYDGLDPDQRKQLSTDAMKLTAEIPPGGPS